MRGGRTKLSTEGICMLALFGCLRMRSWRRWAGSSLRGPYGGRIFRGVYGRRRTSRHNPEQLPAVSHRGENGITELIISHSPTRLPVEDNITIVGSFCKKTQRRL